VANLIPPTPFPLNKFYHIECPNVEVTDWNSLFIVEKCSIFFIVYDLLGLEFFAIEELKNPNKTLSSIWVM
jgi:hypothetical protein